MALYPEAVHRLIRPGDSDPPIEVVGAILHVDAGNAASLYDYFAYRSGGIESHFHIPLDGRTEQLRDTGFEADANLKANSFWSGGKRKGFVSIETQGFGHGQWTAEQLDEIKRLLLWLSKTHGFPLRVTPGPFTPGVGYHTLHGAPSAWTPVAKSCPGPDRIRQFHDVLVPWMKQPTIEENTTLSWNEKLNVIGSDKDKLAKHLLSEAHNRAGDARALAREARNFARRAEAVSVANGLKLDTLLDRSLTEEQRDARIKRIANQLAQQLAEIEIIVTAEVQAEKE